MKYALLMLALAAPQFVFGQTADSIQIIPAVTFSAYAEVFYQYDFNQPDENARPGFLYSHNRHQEVNLNLGYLKAAYSAEKVRGNLAMMVGTYADDNLSAESDVTQHILEANAGVRLGRRTWLDAGIMPSHIGFESAISKDCRTLTRSLAAENSPYFETGVKVTFQPNDQWTLAALYLNGWQRVARPPGNTMPAFGTQITWKPNEQVTLNYSTFLGSDQPDESRRVRQFHDFYGIFAAGDWEFTAGFDFGAEQKRKGDSDVNTWFTPVLIVRCQTSAQTALALRAEYFEDKNSVLIATGTPNGFQTLGFSLNFDYHVSDHALWRIEGRVLSSEDDIFVRNDGFSATRPYLTTSLAISF